MEVIKERTVADGEEDTVSHDVEVKESRDEREDADGERGPRRGRCSGSAMGEQVESLGQAGNNESDRKIAQQARAQSESLLLQSSIEAGG